MFDFVHIIKTIRNNWINQKDPNRTFTFPSFDDFTLSNSSSFEDIRVLYKEEQRSVAKTAHRLTAKSCWPSNLERQNVGLASRIFNDSTSAALQLKRSKKRAFCTDIRIYFSDYKNMENFQRYAKQRCLTQ